MSITNIPVTYLNKTGQIDFRVVVFTKNENPNAIDTPFVAWQTLKAQTSASFVYPVDTAVGAEWIENDLLVRSGPFSTNLGATWKLCQAEQDGTPVLEEGET